MHSAHPLPDAPPQAASEVASSAAPETLPPSPSGGMLHGKGGPHRNAHGLMSEKLLTLVHEAPSYRGGVGHAPPETYPQGLRTVTAPCLPRSGGGSRYHTKEAAGSAAKRDTTHSGCALTFTLLL